MKQIVILAFICAGLVLEGIWLGYLWPKPQEYPLIDSSLKPYLEEFIHEAEIREVYINPEMLGVMTFAPLIDDIAGFCDPSISDIERTAVILIKTTYEQAAYDPDDYTFKALVFHELGHCLLGKKHDPDEYLTIMTSHPISLSPFIYSLNSMFFRKTWKDQLDDLFYRKPGDIPPLQFYLK